ncbi:putative pre-mrna-splicing factor 38a ixodes scapularis pre-mrna-splicing factor 38a [Fasciola hepatica]|uniref:Pre-mRNA-splicing factor 38 n=1 Tax=Fasciola hepatica TaxID=6192 RepID=A0A4E0RZQ5_FASHE|nr:putative pre-mrna-splicing factor 38a ixodes scapularis pre-mrna-splicing factor 38a [Fasciola hepatica]
MANRTVKDAHTVHGTNPQYLVEKIIRSRIYESKYWKEHCFALTAELLVDKAVELRYVGGVYGGNVKPTPFLCLALKMLQIQPDKDIVIEFIKQEPYKYARALGAFYLRLVGDSVEIYKYLETLYNDFRRLKFQDRNGNFSLMYMDDFIDSLLTEERVCDVILPRLQKRVVLEEATVLEPRQSLLNEDLDDLQYVDEIDTTAGIPGLGDDEEEGVDGGRDKRKSRDRPRHRDRDREHRDRDRDRERDRERNREREHERDRERDRSRERDYNSHRRRHRDDSPHVERRDRKDRMERDRERKHDHEKRGRRSRSRDHREGGGRPRNEEGNYSPDHKRSRDKDRDRGRRYQHS